MKKLLLSSIILLTFAISLLIFDVSCKKEAKAQNNTTQQSKILYIKSGQTEGHNAIYSANYDGSGQEQIPIILPNDLAIDQLNSVSLDKKTIFFTVYNTQTSASSAIYSCNMDGGNVKKLIEDAGETIAF